LEGARGRDHGRALAALDTALNAIDAPAFIVDLGGDVLHVNTNAQVLLDRDRQGVSRSLVAAVTGAPAVGWVASDSAAGQRIGARLLGHHAAAAAPVSPQGHLRQGQRRNRATLIAKLIER
jgi:hypothetical protein